MEDTIAAIATAPGEGGIGIIRISGEEALPILQKIFRGRKTENKVLTYGHIYDNFSGDCIDEVMAVYMKGPHSYTAEDVVEIQCHGSIVSLRKILSLTLRNGARLAEPGEFTKRAFLNGRLDLSQAEAVIDLIRARSDASFDVALGQLEGKLGSVVREIRADILDLLVNITVNIDYPDEDIEELTYENLLSGLTQVKEKISALLSTADTGRMLREGLSVSIIGKPNVGKSSLLNRLNPNLNLATNDISDALGRGKHTTRHTELFKYKSSYIVDTPGFSALDIKKEFIDNVRFAFPEFKNEECKFNDCKHINEKDCQILTDLENGLILKSRYESYKKVVINEK